MRTFAESELFVALQPDSGNSLVASENDRIGGRAELSTQDEKWMVVMEAVTGAPSYSPAMTEYRALSVAFSRLTIGLPVMRIESVDGEIVDVTEVSARFGHDMKDRRVL